MNRQTIARMFFEDAFPEDASVTVEWIDDFTWTLVRQATSMWHKRGINPAGVDPDLKKMIVLINMRDLITASSGVKEWDFNKFLLYWKTALQTRIIVEAEVINENPNLDDRQMFADVELRTQERMRELGMERVDGDGN